MPFDKSARHDLLKHQAPGYVDVALTNIVREFPVAVLFIDTGAGPYRTHRQLHPAFYGSFDWHSCVELHWVIVRLLRHYPDLSGATAARAQLRALLTPDNLATELAFFEQPHQRGWERPYGWAWFLTLHHELVTWDDPDARDWAAATAALAEHMSEGLLSWLPKLTYPVRCGFHPNTAFALARAMPWAHYLAANGDDRLETMMRERAQTWFGADIDYPARYEPSGSDFLSAALTEADLMAEVLDRPAFGGWLDRFLQGVAAGEPAQLFEPAVVSDASDGHIAHLHGLNLYRAHGFCRIAEALGGDDPRSPVLLEAAQRHADASLAQVTGSDYMVEHWLAAYATLLLSA